MAPSGGGPESCPIELISLTGVDVMAKKDESSQPLQRIWRWFQRQIVQSVPEDTALCEFDCRKQQCTMGEWESCDRRIRKAAGELMPAPKR